MTRLVDTLAARDGAPADPDDLPIVVLWGARGSDSSALLRHLYTRRDWDGPRAHLDGETLAAEDETLRPHIIAARLAFQLGRKVKRFGRARFPRFFLGIEAIREPLDPNLPVAAQAARKDLIRRQLSGGAEGRQWLRQAVQALANAVGVQDQLTEAVGLTVDGTVGVYRTATLLRGNPLQWYRDGLGRPFADPVDALVELSMGEGSRNYELVDEVLCRAFVADLRAEFASGVGRFYVRHTSALVLLDNVGRSSTRRFVELLAAQSGTSGPLLVVAASHLRFPDAAAKDPVQYLPVPLRTASTADRTALHRWRGPGRFQPVWVDPVDEIPDTAGPSGPAVQALGQQYKLQPTQFRAVAFARRLTAAHPAGLELLVETLVGTGGVPHHGVGPRDLRGLFDLQHSTGQQLDDVVLDRVAGPSDALSRRALMLLGIAVDLSDAHLAPILSTSGVEAGQRILRFREHDLWVDHLLVRETGGAPRMHPFARRAIAHRLGRSPAVHGLSWESAHALLGRAADLRGDRPTALYHDLARGRVHEVAAALSASFHPDDAPGWYALMRAVTRAPVARPARAADSDTHLVQLCPGSAPDTLVPAALVASLQLHTDPLGDPTHRLCGVVAAQLGALAQQAVTGQAFLLAQSQVFADCRQRWHDS